MECEHLKSLAQSNGLKESVAGFDERAYQGEIEDTLQQAGICERFYIFVIFAWIFHRKIVMYLVGRKCYLRGLFLLLKLTEVTNLVPTANGPGDEVAKVTSPWNLSYYSREF